VPRRQRHDLTGRGRAETRFAKRIAAAFTLNGSPASDRPDALRAEADPLGALQAQVRAIILDRQHPDTGLLPASTAVTVHGDYTDAWVRDNVYSILAVWALSCAFERAGRAGADTLREPVIKLMRGLLVAMMRQSAKVERFKHDQRPLDALHAKYDTQRGEPVVGDADWGHLQLDATALYVLMLAQMSAGGLALVQTLDEAAFVQNLVHYLAKAYRTPDYGIWERGHKRNEGRAELNASSLGMAKAALEAIRGFDPLPGQCPPVQVVEDDIAHAREALEALLPRESASKETDAALLSVVGFPAFAVDDAALAARTRALVLSKLQGRYGCKRFLRDGHQTVLEDHARLHYEPGELSRFEGIESEWPLFFTYLLIESALKGPVADSGTPRSLRSLPPEGAESTRERPVVDSGPPRSLRSLPPEGAESTRERPVVDSGNHEEASDWRKRLDDLAVDRDGQRLLPELYVVPAAAVEAERAHPRSQQRVPNANVPLVWAQSLYFVGALLHDGLLEPRDIDPLGRSRAATPAAQQVQLLLLAEDALLQARLAVHGLTAPTPDQLAPVQLVDAPQLVAAMAHVGRCEALGLSGRPPHPVGGLTTAFLFEYGEGDASGRALCVAPFARPHAFHLALDNRLLIDHLATDVAYLRRHWRHGGAPVLVLPVSTLMLEPPGRDELISHLQVIARGDAPGITLARWPDLLPRLARRRLEGLAPGLRVASSSAPPVDTLPAWEEAATRPLTPSRAAAIDAEHDEQALHALLAESRNPYEQAELVTALWRLEGRDAQGAWRALAQALHARACRSRRWGVVRRMAGVLGLHEDALEDALEDAVAQIVLRGKRLALGRGFAAGSVVDRTLGGREVAAILDAHGDDDPRERALTLEFVLLLGMLIKADASLFAGTLTLQPAQSMRLLAGWLAREHGLGAAEAFDHLLDLSPNAILGRLREVLRHEREMTRALRRQRLLHRLHSAGALVEVEFPPVTEPPGEFTGGWAAWRETTGAIGRVPAGFHERVWALLQHCDALVIGSEFDPASRLDSAVARADSTPGERAFALQVDELLHRIAEPAYRQLCVETLLALSDIARANPGLRFDGPLVLDGLIASAVALGRPTSAADRKVDDEADAEDDSAAMAGAWQAFLASPPNRVGELVMAALARLLVPADARAALPATVRSITVSAPGPTP
jgi:phosphorylase kinase alpha/beta subunit